MEKIIAWHGRQEQKDFRIARARAHRQADELVQGYGYWEDGKGCMIGCSYHSGNHLLAQAEDGIPVSLAHTGDQLFERLPKALAMMWPERFFEAVPVGADLSLVWDQQQLWVLERLRELLKDEHKASLDGIIGLWRQRAAGNLPTMAECVAVRGKILADRADRADLADLPYRADLADLPDRADLADLPYHAYRAYRADLADRAELADLAGLADLADLATEQSEQLLKLLAAAPVAEHVPSDPAPATEGMPTSPMPRYQCHKKVWALKIVSIDIDTSRLVVEHPFAPVPVGEDFIIRHQPHAGGYYVVYEDGYKSFSPREAFESGYTRIS